MNIKEISSVLANMCIYYYYAFHEKIYGIIIDELPNYIYDELFKEIINMYISNIKDEYVYDIHIMDFLTGETIILEDNSIDSVEIMKCIDDYIDNHLLRYDTSGSLPVISISNHPIERYIVLTHNWIKWTIDFYRL